MKVMQIVVILKKVVAELTFATKGALLVMVARAQIQRQMGRLRA